MTATTGKFMSSNILALRVARIREDGEWVRVMELRSPNSSELPPFSAGAHIDLYLGNGLVRQYSLCNSDQERDRYVIAIARSADNQGGSVWLHDSVSEGDTLKTGLPRNLFPLSEEIGTPSVLIAGGIGITPMLSMARTLEREKRPWELHFTARTRAQAPLFTELQNFAETCRYGRVSIYLSRENNGRRLELKELIERQPAETHFYCCGSNDFLDAYLEACIARPERQVHLERFSVVQEAATAGGFTLVLARSGKTLSVPAGKTILEVLKQNGVDVNYTCSEGVCGSCEVAVLEGRPDHRDAVLSHAERAGNRSLMVCCSGSLSDRLVLDL